jgi:hypothetical protein
MSELRRVTLVVAFLITGMSTAAFADEIPAGTQLHLRLQQMVSSFGSRADTRVSARLIAPIVIDGRVALPLATEVFGHVEGVRRVGLGLSRETAFVHLTFDMLRLPDGAVIPIDARVAAIDNARETVDRDVGPDEVRVQDNSGGPGGAHVGAFTPIFAPATARVSITRTGR